jgi:hypothetical protein
LGAAQALRQHTHSKIFPADQKDYQRALLSAQAGMNQQDFDAAELAGKQMSAAEAVSFALALPASHTELLIR